VSCRNPWRDQHRELISVAEAERAAGEPDDAGGAGANHFELGSTAKTQLFEATNLVDATDNLPHDGGLSATQHTKRDHVGHRKRLYRRSQLKLRLSINSRPLILRNHRPEYNGAREKIVKAGKASLGFDGGDEVDHRFFAVFEEH
jgi:hypothetical protein